MPEAQPVGGQVVGQAVEEDSRTQSDQEAPQDYHPRIIAPLLINPAARSELVLGKLGATLVFIAVAIIEILIGFAVMLNFLPVEDLGLRVGLSPASLAGTFLVTFALGVALTFAAARLYEREQILFGR